MHDTAHSQTQELAGSPATTWPISALFGDLNPYLGAPTNTPLNVPTPSHLGLIEIGGRLGLDGWLFEVFRYGMARRLCARPEGSVATLSEFGTYHHVAVPIQWGCWRP